MNLDDKQSDVASCFDSVFFSLDAAVRWQIHDVLHLNNGFLKTRGFHIH